MDKCIILLNLHSFSRKGKEECMDGFTLRGRIANKAISNRVTGTGPS